MSVFKKSFELKSGLKVEIKRIQTDEVNSKKYKMIPIQNSAFWVVSRASYDNEQMFLPKLYAALVYLTGDSDNCYDDFKGAYSFTFDLNVQKNNFDSQYIYHLYHYRSYIDFSVYEKASTEDSRDRSILHSPNNTLFSDDDIGSFSIFFCSYLLGYIEGCRYTPAPFLKFSDSNLLLFGYADGEYFTKQYKDEDEYYNKKKSY